MTQEEIFMARALELAKLGAGLVSPNPLVGCVIVHEGKIVGEGWHKKYGENHAEVNAIKSVKDQTILNQCDLYINLEPCNHYGKTPPCADLIIEKKIKRVVIANLDTNKNVKGNGAKRLKDSGIEVVSHVLERQGIELNKFFFTAAEKNRPYIILKWAETADGFIARENFDSKWISNIYSRQFVHKIRSEVDAILIGRKTAAIDNPELTTRHWSGPNPVRVVLDRTLKLNDSLRLFDNNHPTLVFNNLRDSDKNNVSFIKLNEHNFMEELLQNLVQKKCNSVLVEGGSLTLEGFINANLWDEVILIQSSQKFGSGIKSPQITTNQTIKDSSVLSDRYLFLQPRT